MTWSKDLLDSVNWPVSVTFPNAHCEQAIEERVLRRGGLEARQRAEIVVRVVAHASECHMDQRPVVGLERHTEIELARSIGGGGHPVRAAEDDAAQALSFKRPTRNREDRERAMWRQTDLLDRGSRKTQAHQRTGVHGASAFRNTFRGVHEWCRSDLQRVGRRLRRLCDGSRMRTWGVRFRTAESSENSRRPDRPPRRVPGPPSPPVDRDADRMTASK